MEFSHKIKIIWAAVLLMLQQLCTSAQAQLRVVKKMKTYCAAASNDSLQTMKELKTLMPALVYDLRYATPANFTRTRLYNSSAHTYLRLPAAYALQKVQDTLRKKGLGLKIFDAYRPYGITVKMWNLIGDERYVANPANGSGHNRGLAVDLTIIDLKTGKELDMGTGFDNFTDSAHHSFKALPADVLANRTVLRETMEQFGFRPLSTEWWHYSWPNDNNYDVLDLNFRELAKRCH